MKYILLTIIISICTITIAFAVNTYPVQTCDSLKLTDGRIVAVQILRQTDDRIFFTLCEDEAKKEGIILKRFVEAIISDRKVVDEPSNYVKARNKREEKSNRLLFTSLTAVVGYVLLVGGGLILFVAYAIGAI